MTTSADLPRAFQTLCRAYSNADWDLDGPDGRAIVASFVRESPHEDLVQAHAEARELLQRGYDEDALQAHLEEIGLLFFDPETDGMAWTDWLAFIVATTASRLGADYAET